MESVYPWNPYIHGIHALNLILAYARYERDKPPSNIGGITHSARFGGENASRLRGYSLFGKYPINIVK